jgi:hypothetical protein
VEALAKAKPTKRVGLVTFATDVTILGDGSGEPRVLAGARLSDFAVLKAAGAWARSGWRAVLQRCLLYRVVLYEHGA